MTQQPDNPDGSAPKAASGANQSSDEAAALGGPPGAPAAQPGVGDASDYVPPTPLATPKTEPPIASRKVRIADDVNPRQVKTEPAMRAADPGSAPEAPAPVPPAPVMPFANDGAALAPRAGGTAAAAPPPGADPALPFTQPGQVATPPAMVTPPVAVPAPVTAAVQAVAAPGGGVGAHPLGHRSFPLPGQPGGPPLWPSNPGVLTWAGAQVAMAGVGAAPSAPAVPAAAPTPAPAAAPAPPPQPMVVEQATVQAAAVVAPAAPAPVSPAAAPAAAAPPATAAAAQQVDPSAAGVAPPAAGPSPWSAEEKVDVDILPSANILTPADASDAHSAPAPPPEAERSPRTRMAFIIGLALAALVLVVALVYIVARPSGDDDEPTSVEAGSENRDWGDEPSAAPTTTASATAKPKLPPRPVHVPKPKPKPTAREDIYEELE